MASDEEPPACAEGATGDPPSHKRTIRPDTPETSKSSMSRSSRKPVSFHDFEKKYDLGGEKKPKSYEEDEFESAVAPKDLKRPASINSAAVNPVDTVHDPAPPTGVGTDADVQIIGSPPVRDSMAEAISFLDRIAPDLPALSPPPSTSLQARPRSSAFSGTQASTATSSSAAPATTASSVIPATSLGPDNILRHILSLAPHERAAVLAAAQKAALTEISPSVQQDEPIIDKPFVATSKCKGQKTEDNKETGQPGNSAKKTKDRKGASNDDNIDIVSCEHSSKDEHVPNNSDAPTTWATHERDYPVTADPGDRASTGMSGQAYQDDRSVRYTRGQEQVTRGQPVKRERSNSRANTSGDRNPLQTRGLDSGNSYKYDLSFSGSRGSTPTPRTPREDIDCRPRHENSQGQYRYPGHGYDDRRQYSRQQADAQEASLGTADARGHPSRIGYDDNFRGRGRGGRGASSGRAYRGNEGYGESGDHDRHRNEQSGGRGQFRGGHRAGYQNGRGDWNERGNRHSGWHEGNERYNQRGGTYNRYGNLEQNVPNADQSGKRPFGSPEPEPPATARKPSKFTVGAEENPFAMLLARKGIQAMPETSTNNENLSETAKHTTAAAPVTIIPTSNSTGNDPPTGAVTNSTAPRSFQDIKIRRRPRTEQPKPSSTDSSTPPPVPEWLRNLDCYEDQFPTVLARNQLEVWMAIKSNLGLFMNFLNPCRPEKRVRLNGRQPAWQDEAAAELRVGLQRALYTPITYLWVRWLAPLFEEFEVRHSWLDMPDSEDIWLDAVAIYRLWKRGIITPTLFRGMNKERRALDPSKKKWGRDWRVVGENGLVVGQWWPRQLSLIYDGAHGSAEAGIAVHGDVAVSLVLSGGHAVGARYDDIDSGDEVVYCGTRGAASEFEGGKGTISRSTQALFNSMHRGIPVRFIRSSKCKGKETGNRVWAPKEGFRYDGLYEVVKGGETCLDIETNSWSFTLRRTKDQPAIRCDGPGAKPNQWDLQELQNCLDY